MEESTSHSIKLPPQWVDLIEDFAELKNITVSTALRLLIETGLVVRYCQLYYEQTKPELSYLCSTIIDSKSNLDMKPDSTGITKIAINLKDYESHLAKIEDIRRNTASKHNIVKQYRLPRFLRRYIDNMSKQNGFSKSWIILELVQIGINLYIMRMSYERHGMYDKVKNLFEQIHSLRLKDAKVKNGEGILKVERGRPHYFDIQNFKKMKNEEFAELELKAPIETLPRSSIGDKEPDKKTR